MLKFLSTIAAIVVAVIAVLTYLDSRKSQNALGDRQGAVAAMGSAEKHPACPNGGFPETIDLGDGETVTICK